MSDHEIQRQYMRDTEYRRAWEALTPEQVAEMAAVGIKSHDCDREPAPYRGERVIVGRDGDIGTLCDRSGGVEVDFAGSVDKLSDHLAEDFGVTRLQAVKLAAFIEARTKDALTERSALLLARIVGFFLIGSDNLQARAHGLAHAARMARRNGLLSLRHSAKLCGVSPEWMRRVAWRWCDTLDLPPLEDAKSPAARASYRHDKLTNHHRTKKCTTTKPQNKKRPSIAP